MRLAQADPGGRLHVALTHGMEPFEKLQEPTRGVQKYLLYNALDEAGGEPKSNEREIVKAYRSSRASRQHYPNTAELLRTVIGTDRLSGGITEVVEIKYMTLAETWSGSGIVVARSSWREQLGPDGALGCPDNLDAPWLFSMDPMTYSENGSEGENLNGSDLSLLEYGLRRYFDSTQPGIACFFVYGMKGIQQKKPQRRFWEFADNLAGRLRVHTCSYWVTHLGGDLNLVGLLFSDDQLAVEFDPPNIGKGRERQNNHVGTHDISPDIADTKMPLNEVTNMSAAGRWSPWRAFPDPRERAYLCAPFGPGVYELRNSQTRELVLVW